jgi:hypothetical protein
MKQHMPILRHWLTERAVHIPNDDEIPSIGYILYTGNVPIAIGFLRLVEGGYGYIDSLATNPKAPATIRDKALDQIFTSLIEKAKELELKGLSGTSIDEKTLMRAQRHGFLALPHITMTLTLKDKGT